MSTIPADVTAWLSGHHGVITISRLRRAGLDDHRVARLVRQGVLERVGRGVYRLAGAPRTPESAMAALSAQHPQGYLTGVGAARLLGARGMPRDHRLTLCVPMGAHPPVPAGVVLWQSTLIEPGMDHIDRDDGIRLATASRLAFDLAAVLDDERLADFVEDALHRRWTDVERLAGMARRMAARGRDGSARFNRVLHDRIPGGELESGGEVKLGRALVARGVPLVAQVGMLDVPGLTPIRLDFAVPSIRWGIEADLHPTHHRLLGASKDKRRDRRLLAIDWAVSRVTRIDLADFDALVDELVELYQARTRALANRSQFQAPDVA